MNVKQIVRNLYISGQSTRKIAKIVGKGNATIYRWCKDIIRSKSESLQGDKHPLFKGGCINDNGYRVRWHNKKLTGEHRLVMGLPDGMVVHHINENKLDNRPENLQIMTRTDHIILHRKGKPSKLKGRKLGKYSDDRRLKIKEGIIKYHASKNNNRPVK